VADWPTPAIVPPVAIMCTCGSACAAEEINNPKVTESKSLRIENFIFVSFYSL
jgi:hypothetical protein